MPSRTAVALILAFWLVTTGWMVRREFWPWFQTDRPPSLGVGLAEEAYTIPIPVRWVLYRNGEEIGRLITLTDYRPEDDTFALTSRLREFRLDFPLPLLGTFRAAVPEAETELRATREGALRGLSSEGELSVQLIDPAGRGSGGLTIGFSLTGEVRGGQLWARASLASPAGELEEALDPVPVPSGTVLNPMQPLDRIRGLRAGQSWQQARFSPVEEALRVAGPKLLGRLAGRAGAAGAEGLTLPGLPERRVLRAQVAPEPRDLDWHGKPASCWVIEYFDEELVARTWVRREDSRVLRQEAFERLSDEELVLEREE